MRIDLNPGYGVQGTQVSNIEALKHVRSVATVEQHGPAAEFQNRVAELSSAALSAPEVRAGKVQALREQIATGVYQVSTVNAANALLNELRRLR